VVELSEYTRRVSSVCFSPDGRSGLSGSFDRTIRLWNIATGRRATGGTYHRRVLLCDLPSV
jgi:WD40 repeat protein